MLKPQDLLVALKLLTAAEDDRTFPRLAASLGMSASEVHASVKRAVASGLVNPEARTARKAALLEFLVHGVRYAFPPERTRVTRGVPTSHAAPPLSAYFAADDLPPVWPYAEGTSRGEGLAPLYRSAPEAALRDPQLYELLVLVDAMRAGRARERKLASDELGRRLA